MMTGSHVKILITAVVISAGVAARTAQAPDPAEIVEQFYPPSLIESSNEAGPPFIRNQCFAVLDTEPSGAPRTILASYTNGSGAAVRVLRASTGAFSVVADPTGYDLFGLKCNITLVDLNGDGQKEAHVSFVAGARGGTVDWVFKWDGQQLQNLTPVIADPDYGILDTELHDVDFVDVDSDGVQEILVNVQSPPDETPTPHELYRFSEGRFVKDQPVIGLWSFERETGSPVVETVPVLLPQGATGPYILRVVNGTPGGGLKVTSGYVKLNGEEIVGSSDFGHNVDLIERTVTLAPTNELEVRVAGQPSHKMTVVIKSANWTTP